jgi:hypothetical protein
VNLSVEARNVSNSPASLQTLDRNSHHGNALDQNELNLRAKCVQSVGHDPDSVEPTKPLYLVLEGGRVTFETSDFLEASQIRDGREDVIVANVILGPKEISCHA